MSFESEKNIPEFIPELENIDSISAEKKMELLLTHGGYKKVTEIEFESDECSSEEDKNTVNEGSDHALEITLQKSGLIFEKEKIIAKSRMARQEDNYEFVRNVERLIYRIGKTKQDIEMLKIAEKERDDEAHGTLYGFPKTAIEAYIADDVIDYKELPEEIRNSDAYSFATFRLSKNNWREELKTCQEWAGFARQQSPKLYNEYINFMKSVKGR